MILRYVPPGGGLMENGACVIASGKGYRIKNAASGGSNEIGSCAPSALNLQVCFARSWFESDEKLTQLRHSAISGLPGSCRATRSRIIVFACIASYKRDCITYYDGCRELVCAITNYWEGISHYPVERWAWIIMVIISIATSQGRAGSSWECSNSDTSRWTLTSSTARLAATPVIILIVLFISTFTTLSWGFSVI